MISRINPGVTIARSTSAVPLEVEAIDEADSPDSGVDVSGGSGRRSPALNLAIDLDCQTVVEVEVGPDAGRIDVGCREFVHIIPVDLSQPIVDLAAADEKVAVWAQPMAQQEFGLEATQDALLRVNQTVVGGIGATQLNGGAHTMPRGQAEVAAGRYAEVLAASQSGEHTGDRAEGRELQLARCGGVGVLRFSGAHPGDRGNQQRQRQDNSVLLHLDSGPLVFRSAIFSTNGPLPI